MHTLVHMHISSSSSSSTHASDLCFSQLSDSLSLFLSLSLTLSLTCHQSLSLIGARSLAYIQCSHRSDVYVFTGRPTLTLAYAGVHNKTSLMSFSLLLQRCSACHILLNGILYEMVDRWQYSCCFMEHCFRDLIITATSILVKFTPSFFSLCILLVY